MGPSPHVLFMHAKQRLLDPKNKSLWFPEITCRLCMQYCMISTRNTCLCRSQPLSVVFASKTATFGEELQVLMGPSPHLRFLHPKQRLLDQHKSLYGYQTSPVVLCMQNSVISTSFTRLYGFQPSSLVLCIQTA